MVEFKFIGALDREFVRFVKGGKGKMKVVWLFFVCFLQIELMSPLSSNKTNVTIEYIFINTFDNNIYLNLHAT